MSNSYIGNLNEVVEQLENDFADKDNELLVIPKVWTGEELEKAISEVDEGNFSDLDESAQEEVINNVANVFCDDYVTDCLQDSWARIKQTYRDISANADGEEDEE